MDFLKEGYAQAGAVGVLVVALIVALVVLWKRYCKMVDHNFATSTDSAAAAERFRSTGEAMGRALEGNTQATRELTLTIARWGGKSGGAA